MITLDKSSTDLSESFNLHGTIDVELQDMALDQSKDVRTMILSDKDSGTC